MTLKSKKIWIALGVTLALVVAVLGFLRGLKPQVDYFPVEEIDKQAQASGMADCFWFGFLSTHKGSNYAFPDAGASYWVTQFTVPAGAHLELSGEYPHSRHMSFNTYDELGQPVDRLNDVGIAPADGSKNPFLPGAARTGGNRHYAVQLVVSDIVAGASVIERDKSRPVNTLYAPRDSRTIQLMYRNYVEDRGLTPKGGVELPQPRLVFADGRTVQGAALCKDIVVKEKSLRDIHFAKDKTLQLLSLSSKTTPFHPAQTEPQWKVLVNAPMTLAHLVEGTALESAKQFFSTKPKGGFYSTIDNTYISAYVDNRLGDTLVIQGRAPTTPQTLAGSAVMQAAQLRYWSFCKYRSIYATAGEACVYDEQAPVNARGDYTIVFSTPDMRPSNAREECGVAWAPWGAGDGLENPHGGFLVYRNMMPAADFTQSAFAVLGLGDEKRAMGSYYPRSAYQSKATFEARGCPVKD